MERYDKDKIFHIKYSGIWQIFENKYGLDYIDIQIFTEIIFENQLRLEGYETWQMTLGKENSFDNQLKLEGHKTRKLMYKYKTSL